jgi:hypothetical protein
MDLVFEILRNITWNFKIILKIVSFIFPEILEAVEAIRRQQKIKLTK